MLKIITLQFLFKNQGLFDTLFSSISKITLSINQQFDYLNLQQKTNTDKVTWNTDSIPAIQLPQHIKENQLTFQLYKDNNYVGKARSFVQFGRNKKDCLDIVNKNFQIVGKLLYQAKWSPKTYQQKMITLDQYYTEGKGSFNQNPYTTPGLQRLKQQQQKRRRSKSNRQRQIFQHNQFSDEQQKIGCFSCFSSNKKISTLDQIQLRRLRNYPILIKQSQLKLIKGQNLVVQTIQKPMFYSKTFYRSKNKSM